MRPDAFMVRIDEECSRAAHEAMAKPGDSLFAYGRVTGYYAGLLRARQLYEELMSEDARRANMR